MSVHFSFRFSLFSLCSSWNRCDDQEKYYHEPFKNNFLGLWYVLKEQFACNNKKKYKT